MKLLHWYEKPQKFLPQKFHGIIMVLYCCPIENVWLIKIAGQMVKLVGKWPTVISNTVSYTPYWYIDYDYNSGPSLIQTCTFIYRNTLIKCTFQQYTHRVE